MTVSSLLAVASLVLVTAFFLAVVVGNRRHGTKISRAGFAHDCEQEATSYWKERPASNEASGYTFHYNLQRHQCLVDIRSKRPMDGGVSVYDEIANATGETFIASRTVESGVRGMRNNTVIMGAPVSIDKETAAQIWFNGLMTK